MKNLSFLFPGQGSQYVGMGRNLISDSSIAKSTFEEASEILGFNLTKLCLEGDIAELTKTQNAQPAILTASVAAFRVFNEKNDIEPSILAGHSLGEISALTCADAIEFSDAVKIVRQRGMFMQQAVPVGVGAMAAIKDLDKEIIEEECKNVSREGNVVCISNYNSNSQIVISGHKNAVEEVVNILTNKGVEAKFLHVSAPFHSPLMKPAADRLREELSKYNFKDLKYDVISNVTALPYVGKEQIVDNLVAQIVNPVRWTPSMSYLKERGMTLGIEFGPKAVLRNLMLENTLGIKVFSYDNKNDVKALDEAIKKNKKVIPFLSRAMGIAVSIKNKNWDNDQYQKGVIEPYRKVQELDEIVEREGGKATMEEMEVAIDMLISVFRTKMVSKDEQIERFKQLFEDTDTKRLFKDFKLPLE
ncbi:ACP S-malonyltransferase [Bacillus thuringiensis]|uniref:ACP S-malonyltransferase n=1 Tax=Bacillus thuringiensis TaxID=1428 RepID=UPI000BF88209|nr:ACP S-malonyltransferase [Bacillus thuringiensis]PFJ51513.1 [acyl-carrier-protein] S-malonyltransferase [Bacillus thuringiensis]PFR39099.1 [acyl-carrier-protein] S-malonyltransferase [Bacillus thuringiensis]PGL28062.1 [acyl-carrier-protein] S-malonyltransferase [Bacillus thuringiensis]